MGVLPLSNGFIIGEFVLTNLLSAQTFVANNRINITTQRILDLLNVFVRYYNI